MYDPKRLEAVYSHTWNLVAPILGGNMPRYVVIEPGAALVTATAFAWVSWAPGYEGIPEYATVNIGRTMAKWLTSSIPWKRRTAQKKLFHEYRHTRQDKAMLADIVGREIDASRFALQYAYLLQPHKKRKHARK